MAKRRHRRAGGRFNNNGRSAPNTSKVNSKLVATGTAGNDEFWHEFYGQVRHLLCGVIHNSYPSIPLAEVEDAADETIVKVLETFDFERVQGLSPEVVLRVLQSYCAKAARTTIVDAFRKNGRHHTPVSATTRTRERLKFSAAEVEQAFGTLSAQDKRLLELRLIDGWAYKEIAVYLSSEYGQQFTAGQLKVRKQRAVEQLRTILLHRNY